MMLRVLRAVPERSWRAAIGSHRASIALVATLLLTAPFLVPTAPAEAAASDTAAVFAWGDNGGGRLGDGSYTDRWTPVRVSAWTGFTQVAGGGSHSLGLKADGTVWAWGSSCCGEIGDGSQGTSRLTPVQVIDSTGAPLTGVVQVAAGEKHSLAVKGDGTVWAWGQNYYGQLGDGSKTDRLRAVRVESFLGPPLSGITQVAAGERHSLAVRGSDGAVFAWGNNYNGQFGNGLSGNDAESPIPMIASISGVAQVAAGEKHSVAVKTDGTVWAWGANTSGQIGNGTQADIGNPIPVPTPVQAIGLTGVTGVSAGGSHSIAVKSDGTVWTWGNNFYAQLGIGTSGYDNGLVPGRVPGLTGVLQVAAGETHNIVVKADGSAYGWGENGSGQVGDGTTSRDRATPVQVTGLTGVTRVTRIAAGDLHSLAIVEDVTPPDTVIDTGPDAVTNATTASFAFHATGMYTTETGWTFECRLDSTAWASCTSPKAYTGLSAGSHTFLVRATDTAGNTDPAPAQQTWTIDTTAPNTFIDSGPPGVTNATTANFTLDSTETGATFACRLDSGAWAGCTSPKTYTGLAEGWHVFEVRATDPAGNTDPSPAQHAWTIDTTAPVLHLPVDVAADATSAAGATVDYTATATDAIDHGVTAVCVPASGSTFGVGTTTVNCTATDAAGNQTTGSFTVTVTDTPPVLTLPDDMTLEATGPNGAPVTYTATATDAGDGTVPTICTLPSGGMAPLGDTLVVCRAVDSAGNQALGSFVVSVVDTTGPELSLTMVDVAATSAAGAVVDYTGTATDAVDGDVALVCAPPSGWSFALGATTVDCSATDTSGNQSIGSFTVTVTDTGPALILPDDMTVEATSVDGAIVDFTATANDAVDGDLTAVCVPASGSTFGFGATTTVDCSATDSVGNQTTGSFTVTVTDTAAPMLTLPADRTVEATGLHGALVDYTATAMDTVDGDVTATCVPASGSMFGFGVTTVACNASDNAANQATGSFTVTVTDTTAPVLTLPADMTAAATSAAGAVVAYAATAIDAVEGIRPVSCAPASGSTFVSGPTTVGCSAADSLGNEATGSFTVTVTDTGPALVLPDDLTAEATSAAGAVVHYTATATDAVDGDIAASCDPLSGSTFSIGTSTVQCTATDTADNETTGSFSVTVTDTGPVLVLPDDLTVEATGPNGAAVEYTATATDAVDGAVTPICTLPSGGMLPLGDTLVVCRADDSAGNRTLDSFVVSVIDTSGPVLNLAVLDVAATSAAGAVVDYTATATDAVEGDVAVSCDPASGSTFDIGTNTVTCSASDSLGNLSSGSFTVTVTDTGPTLILPDDMTVEATNADGAVVTYAATATDAVDGDITPVCGPSSGSTFSLGTTTVQCSATDTVGNETAGSFTVTVTDTTAPVLSLPDDITLPYQGRPKGAGLVVDYTATAADAVDGDIPPFCEPPSGSKFGLGTTTVECSAIDSAGNQVTGTFTVTIERVSDTDDNDEVNHGKGKGRG